MSNDTPQVDNSITSTTPLSVKELLSPTKLMRYEVESLGNRPVWIRDVPAGTMLDFMMIDEESPERNDGLLDLIAASVVNEDGEPLFNDINIEAMKGMSMKVFTELASIVTDVAGAQVDKQISGDEKETAAGED